MFDGAAEKSKVLGKAYENVATQLGCAFLDAGKVIVSSDLDGIHFEMDQHEKLGKAVAAKVKEILI